MSNRKGYKGDFNPDIQSYIPATKAYKRYTDYRGKDFWTTIDRKGNVYFVSDEANGEYNLYTFDKGAKKPLTKFTTSIKRPSVAANGGKVVFEKDYQVYVYDVASGQSAKVPLKMTRNFTLSKQQVFDVNGKVAAFDVSPDGKKLAFISRGELFVSDIEGKFIQQLPKTTERAGEVFWLKDNRTLLFSQTLNGYMNWYTISADGKSKAKQLTTDKKNNRALSFNKDRSQAVYLSGRDEVRLMDTKTFESKNIVTDEIWALYSNTPRFSPDDKYISFNAIRNFESDIMLYNIATKEVTNLTKTGVTESDPFWSPDGKYIYFSSDRTRPDYPTGAQNPRIYRLALDKFDDPYRIDKFDELFKKEEEKKEEKKDEKKKDDKKEEKKEEKKDDKKVVVTINTKDIMQRVERVGPNGWQANPYVIQKDNKTTILYISNHEGKHQVYKTVLEPFEQPKTEKVSNLEGFIDNIVAADGKYFTIYNGTIYKFNGELKGADKIDLNKSFYRNMEGEFNQMYYETWANLEENFYDKDFHGKNWAALRDQYAKYLPYVNTRNDLRVLLNDLLGELNSSHMGFSSNGPEERIAQSYTTMETGIMFENGNPYKVKYIVNNSNADKKGIDIHAGDVLTKVNGEEVDTKMARDIYFTRPAMERELVLTFNRGGKAFDVKLHPQSTSDLSSQLYNEWIDFNQSYVDKKTNNKVAYTYMKNMGTDELEKFLTDLVGELQDKDALIFDLRYNTGGNVHDAVLNFLSQRPYLQWQYRDGKRSPQPGFAPAGKPIVLLINEQSLSDAEMTSAGFKALKLGTIIGTETYRWIIFTTGRGLVDGSFYRLPSWGCYTLDGKDLEKEGVAPDIYVKTTFADKLENKDPQLDRAIEEIMKQMKK
ncbi:S41 family peptidase [Chitinophaga sedimenti]|uniref:S41 family peptidase n=1 Tax=Chitinophaga sedimenti TaxID=2033606 RepID=UPI002005F658|nr:S41 family peptidase [Chitinophaga sedimenti]MCK7559190.1 S41 family peptidase [Chitinophaga sedimenti]